MLKAPPGAVPVHKEVPQDVARRADPLLALVDARGEIVLITNVSADDRASALVDDDRLAPELVDVARRLAARSSDGAPAQAVIVIGITPWLVRLRTLHAPNGSAAPRESAYAMTVDVVRRREQLEGAVRRFSLTRRESDVLFEILRGASASEIATKLQIAEVTVQGYHKRLLRRTGARNRSAMIARVLGWETPAVLESRPLRTST